MLSTYNFLLAFICLLFIPKVVFSQDKEIIYINCASDWEDVDDVLKGLKPISDLGCK
jgi:hypothetical protein